MNKDKLINMLDLAYKTLLSYFMLTILFFCNSIMASEDYTAYAMEQQEKAKGLITTYQAEIQKIIKNIEQQSCSDDQSFKQTVIETKNTQCPIKDSGIRPNTAMPQSIASIPILIFVSFSMPKESIKGWINQAKKINAAIYIRGLVNNSFKDSIEAVDELVKDNTGGLLIDPTLFKKYSITQVPAVVVVGQTGFDVVYGDVTLDYALNKINEGIGQLIKIW